MQPIYRLVHLGLGDRVILLLRRHWFTFFKKMLKFLLLVGVGIGIYYGLITIFGEIFLGSAGFVFLTMILTLYGLFIWLVLFHDWIDHYLDLWIVTDKEIIDVKQLGLFHRRVSKQPLERVQDVTAESKGFAQTFLHYGDVYIQTAGAKEKFVFKKIPYPYRVADKINDLVRHKLRTSK